MLESIESIRVVLIYIARCVLHVEADDIEFALSGNFRVKLADRAGSGISRICKKLLTVYLTLGVEFVKNGLGHVDFATDDKPFWSINQPERETSHRAQIFGHILADKPVSTGGATHEHAVFVLKRHGKTVNFRLNAVFMLIRERSVHSLAERFQLIKREHIAQTLQRHLMLHLRELRQCSTSDALCGRIRGHKLWVLLLKLYEPLHQHIVVKIGNDGSIINIIKLVVMLYLPAELIYLLLNIHSHFSMFRYVSGTLPTMTVSATMTSVTVLALFVPHGTRTSISIVTSSMS